MVLNGLINTRILAICRELGIEAIGLSGVDAGLIRAHRRAPVPISEGSSETVDYGFVGDIDSVNAGVIEKLLENGLMPVVSPLSADSNGMLLNINADTVAAAIGGALSAEKLVLCTGAPGILERVEDPSTVISYTDIKGLRRLRDAGNIKDGMLPKAAAIENAIRSGVRRVHVITYKSSDSLLAEIFTNEGTGTLVVADLKALSPAEQSAARYERGRHAMTRLWDKGTPLDERVLAYTAGDDYLLDNRLVEYDVRASIAHAEMLAERGLLSDADAAAIRGALTAIGEEHARGGWRITFDQEDCQTAIENLLIARIGETGGRLHAGRSRNDQVLAALRLYLRDVIHALHAGAIAVAEALDALAAREGSVELPGYTHMQQAMPSTVALMGARLRRRDSRRRRGSPSRGTARFARIRSGSAAGYGTPNLDIDRESTRGRLGFTVTHEPVTAVQLSRGKAEAHVLFEITLLTQDLGRLAADLLLFYTQEYGFVSLPASFTTGSSIMPQKRNPDVFELMRGRSVVAHAALNEVLNITQKLTSGYHRDLQLIKPPLFRGIDSCHQTLDILPSALAGVRFNPNNIRLDPSIHAAAEANALVTKENIPFREAYRRVARQVQEDAVSIWNGTPALDDLNDKRGKTLIAHLDIVFTEIGDDFICASMPVDERTHQPYGLLHGGASVVLAETLGSTGANLCVDRSKYLCVGQEINANHVRAVRSGRVTGTARPVHRGGLSQVWSIDIVNESDELICISRLTVAVVKMGALRS